MTRLSLVIVKVEGLHAHTHQTLACYSKRWWAGYTKMSGSGYTKMSGFEVVVSVVGSRDRDRGW